MNKINEEQSFKPTLSNPVSPISKGFESNFNKTMQQDHVKLNETDGLLTEREQSLKKKIFSLAKMEALVFADPKLSAVYDEMSENGEEKYGYHYNETIQNMIFNDYVLNSPKYLQKYKMAIPLKKKRRDKSGINQLKKAGDISMHKKPVNPIQTTPATTNIGEETGAASSGAFAPALDYKNQVEETTGSASSGAYSGPAAWGSGDLMKGGTSKAMRKPIWKGGTIIQESNYLTDPSAFAKYVDMLNEDIDLSYQTKLGDDYQKSHSGSNNGLGVSEIPQSSKRKNLKRDINNNTSLYVGQDVDKMRTNDVKILHSDMTKKNSYFPSKNNPNLPTDGISGKLSEDFADDKINAVGTPIAAARTQPDIAQQPNVQPFTDPAINNKIIDKTAAFSSNTVDQWDKPDTLLQLHTIDHGTMDEPNLNPMEEEVEIGNVIGNQDDSDNSGNNRDKKIKDLTAWFETNNKTGRPLAPVDWMNKLDDKSLDTVYNNAIGQPIAAGLDEIEVNVPAGGRKYSPDMYSTKEDLKELIERTKQRTGKGLQKDQIPMLAGEALYTIAVKMADHLAPIGWNEMADTNSMWDYIDDQGNMSYDRLLAAVKEAVNDRMGGDDMGMMDEKAVSPAQQRLFGMAHAVQKGELSPSKVGGAVKKIAKTVSPKDVTDFASTKYNEMKEEVAGYNVPNPILFKQIGWLPIKSYKYGGVSVFEPTEYEKSKGAQYVIGAPYEEQFQIKPYPFTGKEDNYLIQDNPRFWYKSIKVDDTNNKIYYVGDDGKLKFLVNNQGLEINPSKNWTHNIDNERFLRKLDDMKKSGATFKLTNEMDETAQSIIDDKPDSVAKGTPTGTVSTGNVPVGLVDMKEEVNLFEELNKELEAYSVHHSKLKQMSEDRKPSSLVLKDRLGAENATNFKKDFANSDTKDVINVEKELQWKDQQTDVPADPQKLAQDIENTEIKSTDAKGDEFLKNVGNSANDKGDEIPKRNMTTPEQDEVNMYRKGMHSLNYDNKPDQRFEDRMKADMGDAVYEIRQKQMSEFGKAPMYNKEAQPTEPTKAVRTEFDKEKSGWNDLQGLKESMITGRYRNDLNKSKIIDFTINEVKLVEKVSDNLFPLDFTGLGNSFNAKTADYKVTVNEAVIGVLDAHKFFTDGKQIFAIKNPKQNLSEAKKTPKPPVIINEEVNKMKHLLGYKPDTFVSTDKTKKNRGF